MKYLNYLLIILFFILVVSSATFDILDPDTMTYLAYGRYTSQFGLPRGCIFSYTPVVCPTPYSEWLLHLVIFQIHKFWSWAGLVTFQIMIVFLTFIFIYKHLLKNHISLLSSLIVMTLSLYVMIERFMLRADTFSLLMFAISFYLVSNLSQAINNKISLEKIVKNIIFLLLIQVIWTNTHGSFPIGIILVALFLLEEILHMLFHRLGRLTKSNQSATTYKIKIFSFIFLLVLSVSFLNPYGLPAFLWPIKNITTTSSKQIIKTIGEYTSPFNLDEFETNRVRTYKYITLIGIMLLALNYKKVRFSHFAILSLFFLLSSSALRYISLYALSYALIMPYYFDLTLSKITGFFAHKFKVEKVLIFSKLAFSLLLISIFPLLTYFFISNKYYFWDRSGRRFGLGLSELYPHKAVDFIETNNLPGNMFNSYGFGSYLNWRLYPKYKTYMHGSILDLELVDTVWMYREYQNVNIGNISHQEIADRYNINFFILEHSNPLSSKLVKNLYRDPNWVLIYFDHTAIIFIAKNEQNKAIIDKYKIYISNNLDLSSIYKSKRQEDLVIIHNGLGLLFAKLGYLDLAVDQFEKAVTAYPKDYGDYLNAALTYQDLKQYDKAVTYFQKAIFINPKFIKAHLAFAKFWLGNGIFPKAIKELEDTLRLDKNYTEANYYLGFIYELKGNKSLAKKYYEKELKINPYFDLAIISIQRLSK